MWVKYDSVLRFNHGLAEVELDGKWGFIDRFGQEVYPCKCDSFTLSYNDLIFVRIDGIGGYIDKNGTEFWED